LRIVAGHETLLPAGRPCPQHILARQDRFPLAEVVALPPPREGLDPDDIVTPDEGAALLGIPASTLRTWIQRSPGILGRQVQPLATIGRIRAYDWLDLAALDAEMRRRHRAAAAPAA
jgi:hypothetical protein